jgi:hypothetical protein
VRNDPHERLELGSVADDEAQALEPSRGHGRDRALDGGKRDPELEYEQLNQRRERIVFRHPPPVDGYVGRPGPEVTRAPERLAHALAAEAGGLEHPSELVDRSAVGDVERSLFRTRSHVVKL